MKKLKEIEAILKGGMTIEVVKKFQVRQPPGDVTYVGHN